MKQIVQLTNRTIPVYTTINPHPVKNKPDCPNDKVYKLYIRGMMIKELMEAKESQDAIIEKYKQKVEQL